MPPLTRVIQVAEPMRHGRAAAPLDRSRRSMPNLDPAPPVDAPGQAYVCPVDPLAGVIQMAEPTLGWGRGTRRSLPSAGPLRLVDAPGQARLCPLAALAKAIQVAASTPGWSPGTRRSLPSADPLRLVAALGQAHLCPLDALAKLIQVEEPTPGWGPETPAVPLQRRLRATGGSPGSSSSVSGRRPGKASPGGGADAWLRPETPTIPLQRRPRATGGCPGRVRIANVAGRGGPWSRADGAA
jgi:hypothetical protein